MRLFLIACLIAFAAPACAQGACGRALLMAGPDRDGPAESVQKRMLERECAADIARDRSRESEARTRLDAADAGQGVAQPIARLRAGNLLERAVDPRGGTRRDWDRFRDEGGLGAMTDFYGLVVSKAVVDLDGEEIAAATLDISAAVSPRRLRAALARACRGDETLWRIDSAANGARGDMDAPTMRCAYAAEDGASVYKVTLARR